MSEPPPPPSDAAAIDRRRTRIAVGAAFAIVVIVSVVIAIFGVRRPPEFPLLAERPDPSVAGTIAYVVNEDDGSTCVHALDASGETPPVELHCTEMRHGWIEQLVWTRDGDLVINGSGLRGDPVEQEMLIVSYPDGAIIEQTTVAAVEHREQPVERPDGVRVHVRGGTHSGTAAVVAVDDGDERTLAEVETDGRYEFRSARWSPDGAWVLVNDSEGRLLIVDGDGGEPRVLLESTDDPWRWQESYVAWYVPGDTWQTVDPDDLGGAQGPRDR